MKTAKPSLPRLQTLSSLLAPPRELPYQPADEPLAFLLFDIRTADEFLARYGWRLKYAKARWLIYHAGRWRIDGDGISIVELFQEFRASLVNDANRIEDQRFRRRAQRRVAQLGSLPMLNRILRIAGRSATVAIPEGLHYA